MTEIFCKCQNHAVDNKSPGSAQLANCSEISLYEYGGSFSAYFYLVFLVFTGILPGFYNGTSDDIVKTHQRHIAQRCSSIDASLCKPRLGEQVQLHLRITE